jgi:predicted Zn-dependent peptidase
MEKQVILEEIGMYEDMPSFAIYERTMSTHFTGHPLGQSILGSSASVTALTAEQMRAYHAARYGAGNLVLAAAGNLDWDHLLQLAEQHCGGWDPGKPGRANEEARPHPCEVFQVRTGMNQEHVMQMAPAPAAQSPLRYAAEIVGTIVGDDGTGRLYWDLVETGLAEVADLSYNDYDGSGTWTTYLCSLPQQTKENLARITRIYEEFNRNGPTAEELEQARNKVASRIVLSSERPMGRLVSLGGNWVYCHEYRSVADDLKTLQDLTLEDIRELLERYPLGQTTTVGLGPLEANGTNL